MNKSNAVDIMSRRTDLPDDLYRQMEQLNLHPDWFSYYLKNDTPISPDKEKDPTFWKKLLTASIKNQNLYLAKRIIFKERVNITSTDAIKIRKYVQDTNPYMLKCVDDLLRSL